MATYSNYENEINLKIARNSVKTYSLTFTDSSGDVIDITGWTVYFTVRATNTDQGSALIEKSVSVHSDPTNGQTSITLTLTDTDQTAGTYYYDFRYKTDANTVKTIQYGRYDIYQNITLVS